MEKRERHIVIMAGGIGSRFWPMSTPSYPKQFIDVLGVGKTLLQLTVERYLPLCPLEHFWVVTSSKYIEIVKKQLPDLSDNQILSEPEARNTAPCIGYACWKIQQKYPTANIVVTPSDAFVIDLIEFQRVINLAFDFTDTHNAIVTIGIHPSRPETGYGYICAQTSKVTSIQKVEEFKEKPDIQTAREYLKAGNYFWNSGIFVWNVETITSAFRTFTPALASILDRMALDFYSDNEKSTVDKLFPTCERISIDYAVMEKSKDIFTIPADFGWSDLGSWGTLHSLLPHVEGNNAIVGENVFLNNCTNCIVHTSNESKVVIEGLDNYIVAERENQLLICRLSEEQKIKYFLD